MKADKNTLYSVEQYFAGKLIKEHILTQQESLRKKLLTEEQIDNLISILENNILDDRHRCISVYRHAFIKGEDAYNICVGCGDFFKNNEYFCLTSKGVEEFKNAVRKMVHGKREIVVKGSSLNINVDYNSDEDLLRIINMLLGTYQANYEQEVYLAEKFKTPMRGGKILVNRELLKKEIPPPPPPSSEPRILTSER